MPLRSAKFTQTLKSAATRDFLRRRAFPAAIPFLTLAAWAVLGEIGLMLAATILPLPFLLSPLKSGERKDADGGDFDGLTGLLLQAALERRMEAQMAHLTDAGNATCCFSIKIDGFARLRKTTATKPPKKSCAFWPTAFAALCAPETLSRALVTAPFWCRSILCQTLILKPLSRWPTASKLRWRKPFLCRWPRSMSPALSASACRRV